MAINFPLNTYSGQIFTAGGNSYIWDGYAWSLQQSSTTTSTPTFSSATISGALTTGSLTVSSGTITVTGGAPWVTPSTLTSTLTSYATTSALSSAIAGIATYTLPTASTSVSGGVKVDGTSITIDGSGIIHGANTYTLPAATTSIRGGVVIPAVGTSGISNSSGTISLATSSTTQLGGVIVDGTSITINNGVISGYPGYTLPAATTSVLGGVFVPVTSNSGLTNTSGTIRLVQATTTQLGGVKVDGTTITIAAGGQISAVFAGAITFAGVWSASANSPTLTNGIGSNGQEYICNSAGTVNFGSGNVTFSVGDCVIYNGSINQWIKIPVSSSAGVTNNALTFNSSGGSALGSSFNGSSTLTVDYSTIGASPLAGSANIVTVGTIISGAWNGTIVGATYGGTGVNNGSYTLTLTGGSRTLDQSVANGASPTFAGTNFTRIPNGALTNSSITFGATAVSLGSTISGINGISIGASSSSTGSFTTLNSTSGALNGSIGATTANTGQFTSISGTSLTATSTVTLNTTGNNQSYTTTGVGTITITSGTTGTINNMTIGGTTAAQITGTNIIATTNIYNTQPTPTVLTATGTLSIAQILTDIIAVTSATAVSLTLPTGTLTDAGVLAGALAVNGSFDWYIINLGSGTGAVTMVQGTAHTYVGSVTVAIATTAHFRTRKTATSTFVTYRLG